MLSLGRMNKKGWPQSQAIKYQDKKYILNKGHKHIRIIRSHGGT